MMLEKLTRAYGVRFTEAGLSFEQPLSFAQWDELGVFLHTVEGAVQWWVGDWLNYGQRTYGETYREARALTGYEVQTLKNYAWIAGKFAPSLRKDDLKFSHYAYAAPLDTEEAVPLLEQARREQWTTRETLKAVRAGQQEKRLRRQALPTDKYDILLADPPWRYEQGTAPPRAEIEGHYATMSLDEICALRVADLVGEAAMLFLWSPNPKLTEALAVIEAWGFSYRTNLVWVKDKIGLGHYVRQKHELLLLARRGAAAFRRRRKRSVRHRSWSRRAANTAASRRRRTG